MVAARVMAFYLPLAGLEVTVVLLDHAHHTPKLACSHTRMDHGACIPICRSGHPVHVHAHMQTSMCPYCMCVYVCPYAQTHRMGTHHTCAHAQSQTHMNACRCPRTNQGTHSQHA